MGLSMGKIVSPAGEIDFKMDTFTCKGNDLIVTGRMGMWDSKIYFSYKEVLRLTLNLRLLQAIIMLPIVLIREQFQNKKQGHTG
jgi:hypothetical protein